MWAKITAAADTHPMIYNVMILISLMIAWKLIGCIGAIMNRRRKSLHFKFLLSCCKGGAVILAIVAFSAQFEITQEFAITILQSSSLMVAVLGFAAQAVLADVIAGMVLSVAKPFDIGERIVLADKNIAGVVENITMRHTVIRAHDGSRVLVPNNVINKAILRNSNFDDNLVGTFLEVEIAYEADIDRAIELVRNIVLSEPNVVDKSKGTSNKEISVLLSSLNDSGVTIKTTIWTKTVDESFRTASNIRRNIIKEFAKDGIEIPYPHVTVKK